MGRKLLFVLALTTGAALQAQTTFTAPRGYLTKTGGDMCSVFAYFMNGRQQFGDPGIAKGNRLTLTKLEYRTQTRQAYEDFRGMGRTFSTLSLTLGHTDCSKFSNTFSANYKGAGTLVYSAKTSLPTLSGSPTQTWGNAGSFSFAKSFFFNGTDDLLLDWATTNGTLTNGFKTPFSIYQVDNGWGTTDLTIYVAPGSPAVPGSRHLPRFFLNPGKNCTDSSMTQTTTDAYAELNGNLYADNYPTTSLRGQLIVTNSYLSHIGKGNKAIGVISVGGSDTGVDIGAKCNKLHVNMAFPGRIAALTADNTANARTPNIFPGVPGPYPDSNVGGITIMYQGGYDDSKTKQFALTNAVKIIMPVKPTGVNKYAKGCLAFEFRDASNKLIGPLLLAPQTYFNPIERFTAK